MNTPFATSPFVSFDGAESIKGSLFCPDRYRNLENIFADSVSTAKTFAVRGAGLSYANLSFAVGSPSIDMTQFNRFFNFDQATGVIEVEAGMTLGALTQWSVPRGWYLKVQPGHPSITIGGCLAADVHGKNQFQDLNFKEQVQFIRLYHPTNGFIYCDRVTHPEAFELSCGGFGLTGIALSVGIKLGQLESTGIETETIPVEDIFRLPKLLRENSSKFDLLYSWHEFNSKKNWGRGFLKAGRRMALPQVASDNDKAHGSPCDLSALIHAKPLLANRRGAGLPVSLLRPSTVWLMNLAYSKKELLGGQKRIVVPCGFFVSRSR